MEDVLKSCSLFNCLTDEECESLLQVAIRKTYPKNMMLFTEGDKSHSIYMILRGKVKVTIIDENGKEFILSILGPGDYFGEMAALGENESRSASVVTREPTELLIIFKEDFRRLIGSNPDIVFNLLKGLITRLRDADKKIESLALMDVYGRVARLFTGLARPHGDNTFIIDEKLTHQEIANMVGASREMISRVMKELTTGNYITTEKKQIIINGKLPYSW